MLRNSTKKYKGSELNILLFCAVQFRSKSAKFKLTLPAEAVPLVPIGGLNGSSIVVAYCCFYEQISPPFGANPIV
eukprot:s475_g24.t1